MNEYSIIAPQRSTETAFATFWKSSERAPQRRAPMRR
jgi:hypothetical protein